MKSLLKFENRNLRLPFKIVKDAFILRKLIRKYQYKLTYIIDYLNKDPNAWGLFQSEFNNELDNVFRYIKTYEQKDLRNGKRYKVNKLRKIFLKNFHHIFLKGSYISWSFKKPFGYAGDYKIIDDIYQNNPISSGISRLFDNYFQMSTISVAVRNRKDDFKRFFVEYVNKSFGKINVVNLGSGSCRELFEVFEENKFSKKDINIDCYDTENKAIEFSRNLLNKNLNVKFYNKNILKLFSRKTVNKRLFKKYNLIYSLGLFDYFGHKMSVRIIKNLSELLAEKGSLFIANVRDKDNNPSVHFMEWVGDWNLTYKIGNEFELIFLEAGYKKENIHVSYEQQGVIQYIHAIRS